MELDRAPDQRLDVGLEAGIGANERDAEALRGSLADRLTVLSLSLVYRGTAIPIAWKILRGNRSARSARRVLLLEALANQRDGKNEDIVDLLFDGHAFLKLNRACSPRS